MISKTIKVFSFVNLFTLSCLAGAPKIMVVSVQKVMSSEASKASEERVKQIQVEQETLIKKMDEDLTKQAKALEAKSKMADLDMLEKDQEKFMDAKNKRDLAAKSASEKIQKAVNKEMEKLTKQVQDAARVLQKTKNLDLVLAVETGAVLAHSDNVDLTNLLIDTMKTAQKSDKGDAASGVAKSVAK